MFPLDNLSAFSYVDSLHHQIPMANALYPPGPGTVAPYCGFPISPRPPSGPSSQYSTHPAHAFFLPPSKLSTCCNCYNYLSISLSHFSQQNHYNLQRSANFLVFPFATFPSSRPSCFQNLTSPGFPFCFFHLFVSLPFFPSKSPPSPSQKPAMVTSGLTELSHCITSCILSYSPPHPAQPHTSTPQSIPV